MHGGLANDVRVELEYIDSEEIERDGAEKLLGQRRRASSCPAASAIAAPRARSQAIRYARENKVPFFGICLGMQLAVVEFARNVCGLERRQLAPSSTATPRTP